MRRTMVEKYRQAMNPVRRFMNNPDVKRLKGDIEDVKRVFQKFRDDAKQMSGMDGSGRRGLVDLIESLAEFGVFGNRSPRGVHFVCNCWPGHDGARSRVHFVSSCGEPRRHGEVRR